MTYGNYQNSLKTGCYKNPKKQSVALKAVICLSSCIMSNLDIYTQELVVEYMSNYLTSSFKLGCGVSVVAKLMITLEKKGAMRL